MQKDLQENIVVEELKDSRLFFALNGVLEKMGNVPLAWKSLKSPWIFCSKKGTNPEANKQSVPRLAFIICNKQFNAFSEEWTESWGEISHDTLHSPTQTLQKQ